MYSIKRGIHYSWVICACTVIMVFITSGMAVTAFSVYMPYIKEINQFTDTQVNLITTFRTTASFLAKFSAIWIIHKIDIRRTAVYSCFLAAGAYLCFGFADSMISYLIAAIMTGVCNGLGSMIPATIILNRWFHTRLHFALGICAAGSGLASLICPPVITPIVEYGSLRIAFLTSAAFIIVCTLLLGIFLCNYPQSKQMKAYGADTNLESNEKKVPCHRNSIKSLSSGEMFLLYIAPVFIGAYGISCASVNAIHFRDLGFSPAVTSLAISLFGGMLLVGKILYGMLSDTFGGNVTNTLFLALSIGGLLLNGLLQDSIIMLVVAEIFLGIGLALCTVGISAMASDLVSPEKYEKEVGRFQLAYSAGGMIFSVVPGPMADYFGSYHMVFVLYALMSLIVLLILRWGYQKTKISSAK
ncbi:MAG: MFS transporter [Clostridiales bacterium]|nr:MFS transporter [Clostridiales bacterium]